MDVSIMGRWLELGPSYTHSGPPRPA